MVYNQTGVDRSITPTQDTYEGFQRAYEYYNWQLFEDELPNCLITLQHRKKTYGYFLSKRFSDEAGSPSDEIALNPSFFLTRSVEEVLSTLAHEMTHLWQSHLGNPGRGRYHNREWADKMLSIGLQPSHSGFPDGRQTGDSMNHIILPNSRFQQVTASLMQAGFHVRWKAIKQERQNSESATPSNDTDEKKSGKRIKYSCPACGLNMWGQHNAEIDCHKDKILMPLAP